MKQKDNSRAVLLYVLTDGAFWKIGYSGNLTPRLNAMRSGNPRPISVLHTWLMSENQARIIESICESEFHSFMSQPRRGRQKMTEWYSMHPPILERVKSLGALHGTPTNYTRNRACAGVAKFAHLGLLDEHPAASFM